MASAPHNAILADIRHGDRTYPRVNIVQCHVCQSPHRDQIELLLIEGLPPRQIVSDLPEHHGVSAQAIYRHFP